MRFQIRGDKDYVENGIKRNSKKFRPVGEPKEIRSASLTSAPKWVVIMESIDEK